MKIPPNQRDCPRVFRHHLPGVPFDGGGLGGDAMGINAPPHVSENLLVSKSAFLHVNAQKLCDPTAARPRLLSHSLCGAKTGLIVLDSRNMVEHRTWVEHRFEYS